MRQEYVKLKTLDNIIHFSPSLYFGLTLLIVIILLVNKGISDISVLSILGLTFLLPTIIFYAVQKEKLKFKIIKTVLNENEFKELVNNIAKKNTWLIHSYLDKEFIIKTNPGFINQSWGQHITLKLTTDGILINSIFDTNKGTWIITFGSNSRNIKSITEIIKKSTIKQL